MSYHEAFGMLAKRRAAVLELGDGRHYGRGQPHSRLLTSVSSCNHSGPCAFHHHVSMGILPLILNILDQANKQTEKLNAISLRYDSRCNFSQWE
jgi:hypothetical protein